MRNDSAITPEILVAFGFEKVDHAEGGVRWHSRRHVDRFNDGTCDTFLRLQVADGWYDPELMQTHRYDARTPEAGRVTEAGIGLPLPLDTVGDLVALCRALGIPTDQRPS